jgi:hypothetical protein
MLILHKLSLYWVPLRHTWYIQYCDQCSRSERIVVILPMLYWLIWKLSSRFSYAVSITWRTTCTGIYITFASCCMLYFSCFDLSIAIYGHAVA